MSADIGHGSAVAAGVVPRLERVDGFDGIETDWDALAERSGGIFATALWNRLWWKHFGSERELLLHAARSASGDLAAVVPLYAWRRRRPRLIRFLGHGPGDELGPVYAEGAQALAADALVRALEALDWDAFFGEQLPGGYDWSGQLGARIWRREAAPVLRLPTTWEEYLAGRSPNFRQQLRRREQALARAGRVAFRLADEGTLDRDLDTLFALHRARWDGVQSDFADTPFHRDLAREALARDWLRLWTLEIDDRPVAAWHGFQVGTVTSYYQAGRDPAAQRLSAGFVLLGHTIRAALASGATEYRFGRGDEAFKSRFTSEDPGLETVGLGRGALWASAYPAARLARAVRRGIRRISRT